MDSSGALRPRDDPLLRELPQLSLRIAPLREPVSSRTLSGPSPLEPNARGGRESTSASNTTPAGGTIVTNSEAGLPTVTEFLNAARTRKAEPAVTDPQSNVEPPPKPILPAFVNLRALERFPFSSSFDDDALQGPRKRRRLDLQTDSFNEHLQLPIPQAQKEQRPRPFGPFAILNGLNEPPPNAALLPPIEAGSITQLLTKPPREDTAVDPGNNLVFANGAFESQPVERREARIEELLGSTLEDTNGDDVQFHDDGERPNQVEQVDNARSIAPDTGKDKDNTPSTAALDGDEPLSPKTRGRSRKNVRKWTDDETTDLLRGVVKCGIGNWTAILAQPELKFNKRTASNLKDRFRVCCPWAYRATNPNEATKKVRDNLADALLKAQDGGSDGASSKIQLPPPTLSSMVSEPISGSGSPINVSHKPSASSLSSSTPDTVTGSVGAPTSTSPPTKDSTTLSDKSRTTIASLGIPEPRITTKSKRRSRRPFTDAEDEAILKGYAVHGFQWTLIQQDKRLNLSHRRATDLRDRFRTKFPHAYRDGGSVIGKALQSQVQIPATSKSSPLPRNHLDTAVSTLSKAHSINDHRPQIKTHSRHTSATNSGATDISMLPPPQGFLEPSTNNNLSLPSDESPATPWEDNTLAPMVWDDLS